AQLLSSVGVEVLASIERYQGPPPRSDAACVKVALQNYNRGVPAGVRNPPTFLVGIRGQEKCELWLNNWNSLPPGGTRPCQYRCLYRESRIVPTLRLTPAPESEKHEGEVFSCCYTPDGAFVLSAGWDGHLRLWEVSSGAHLTALKVGNKPLSACAVSPDGKRWVA